ncbi:uncharacterized protein LOC129594838 isoform X2 [Paramacrobiotus metropolitanus]|nr:uncharacterized protein LOC129594838 isoform X2 [Paramacrobiotus metropolitanus]XP_055347661.1 uncharacterized protein LOC129594838 isoform X2 [Paramacrobiotus metropolitanus]
MNPPLPNLRQYLQHHLDVIPEAVASDIIKILDILDNKKRYFLDLCKTLSASRVRIGEDDANALCEDTNRIEAVEGSFTSNIITLLDECHLGHSDTNDIMHFIAKWTDYLLREYSSDKYRGITDKMNSMQKSGHAALATQSVSDDFDQNVLSLYENPSINETSPLAKPSLLPTKCQPPRSRGAVKLPCPGSFRPSTCPPGTIYNWQCCECLRCLEYGFDDHFYCECGKSAAEWFTFQCGHFKHGAQYIGFRPNVLVGMLENLKPFKEINILILGETGVGKSTWINGFVNCITYATLEEALVEPVYLIPARFKTYDDDYNEQTVTMGKSENEDETPGQSSTQMPKTYVIRKDDSIIRLIDTPGIGDTRGAEQDKKNFQLIMKHLANYETLHGICMLLKPNSARLTAMVQFCIKELLIHLHRSACENLVFVFTNTRSTFYRPGDTYPALQQLIGNAKDAGHHLNINLGVDIVYCVDNEAVRFMAAVKCGIAFGDSEKEHFSESWKISVAETDRLLQYLSKRTPHQLRQTLSLNEARQFVLTLTEPLAHITKNIQTNILAAEEANEVLQREKSNKDLQRKLYIPSIKLQHVPLSYTRTVCVAPKCTKIVGQKVNYVTWCHEHCNCVSGVSRDSYPQPALQNCAAMDNSKMRCAKCGCSWEFHMQVDYEQREVMGLTLDEGVQTSLDQKHEHISSVQKTLDDFADRKSKLQAELDEIAGVASDLGCFLRTNAIIPYNDATEAYLCILIKTEEEKTATGGSRSGMENYQKAINLYREEKRIIEEALTKGSKHSQATATDFKTALKTLYNLPINGGAIKQLVDAVDSENKSEMEFSETLHNPIPRNRNKQETKSCVIPQHSPRSLNGRPENADTRGPLVVNRDGSSVLGVSPGFHPVLNGTMYQAQSLPYALRMPRPITNIQPSDINQRLNIDAMNFPKPFKHSGGMPKQVGPQLHGTRQKIIARPAVIPRQGSEVPLQTYQNRLQQEPIHNRPALATVVASEPNDPPKSTLNRHKVDNGHIKMTQRHSKAEGKSQW